MCTSPMDYFYDAFASYLNCLESLSFENNTFGVSLKKVSHTGFEQHEGESMIQSLSLGELFVMSELSAVLAEDQKLPFTIGCGREV